MDSYAITWCCRVCFDFCSDQEQFGLFSYNDFFNENHLGVR